MRPGSRIAFLFALALATSPAYAAGLPERAPKAEQKRTFIRKALRSRTLEEPETIRQTIERNSGTPYLRESESPHEARYLPTGAGSLEQRLRMIESARDSIDVAYYIYGTSPSGALFTRALIRKKLENPGIKIRVLVDYYSWDGKPGIDSYEAAVFAKYGIPVAYFNKAKLAQLWKVSHRDHTKLLVVDGTELVIGGRNISDDSLDFSNEYFNFLDADVWVRGEAAETARQRVEDVWNHETVARAEPAGPDDPQYETKVRAAEERMLHAPLLEELRAKVSAEGGRQLDLEPIYQASHVTFVSDRPERGQAGRVVYPYLLGRLARARSRVTMENYSYIPTRALKELFSSLARNKVALEVLTNGFGTRGADPRLVYMARPDKERLIRDGGRVWEFDGRPLPGQTYVDPYGSGAPGMYGIHSKQFRIDEDWTLTGSFNIDYRSARENGEAMVEIRSKGLAARVDEVYELRKNGAKELDTGAWTYKDGSHSAGSVSEREYRDGSRKNWILRFFKFLF